MTVLARHLQLKLKRQSAGPSSVGIVVIAGCFVMLITIMFVLWLKMRNTRREKVDAPR